MRILFLETLLLAEGSLKELTPLLNKLCCLGITDKKSLKFAREAWGNGERGRLLRRRPGFDPSGTQMVFSLTHKVVG